MQGFSRFNKIFKFGEFGIIIRMDKTEQTALVKANGQTQLGTVATAQFDIKRMIYVICNQQVMTDSDLAMLYQVETKVLNRSVKRNNKRFPEDFCFQLTSEEYEVLRCQFVTSKTDTDTTVDNRGRKKIFTVCFHQTGDFNACKCAS